MSTAHDDPNPASQGGVVHNQQRSSQTFDGKIVSLTGDKLVMKNHEGKECSHTLAKDAKLTRDGTRCNAADRRSAAEAAARPRRTTGTL